MAPCVWGTERIKELVWTGPLRGHPEVSTLEHAKAFFLPHSGAIPFAFLQRVLAGWANQRQQDALENICVRKTESFGNNRVISGFDLRTPYACHLQKPPLSKLVPQWVCDHVKWY
jgi:hypothetical protein